MKKNRFEVRQVDAVWYDDNWMYNTTYQLGFMVTGAKNEARALTTWLRNHAGITFKRNRTRIITDGSVYEIIDRKTYEPLFVAIPED